MKAADPSEDPLDDLPVMSQAFAVLNTARGDSKANVVVAAFASAPLVVVRLVGVELGRSPPRSSACSFERRHCIQHGLDHQGSRLRLAPFRRMASGVPLRSICLDHTNSRKIAYRRSRFHIPAACQSRRRRQQVIPEPHLISTGSISRECPFSRRTGCRSALHGHQQEDARCCPLASAAAATV